jgi:hypothetical protein
MKEAGVARALLRGTLIGLLGFVIAAVTPLPTGPLQLVDMLLFFGVMTGFAATVAVAAVRERRTSHLEGPVVADTRRIEHLVAIVVGAPPCDLVGRTETEHDVNLL